MKKTAALLSIVLLFGSFFVWGINTKNIPLQLSETSRKEISITMKIKTPEDVTQFPLTIREGSDACDTLVKAKEDGKIQSVTLDDTYLKQFNTFLVSEMNGYKNNWTFKVNGVSPEGCSLAMPKDGDTILWEYIK